ncbi:FMN-dependent dehydrogenase-domain-containing protein [Lineolata rhizophorae]|uniref:FMN-dependent dehydrogenase-domain-containing protein n=1 Tax=Lineolata rhizophorae TaxID=578093 RepID=A0A6A6NWE1_9PEZI|nr:FMN-dependent dehydrogenase-domain-containing protein [Lineolata rhizophorae]
MLTGDEVGQHNSRDSCWVIIRGNAYDVTNFLDKHPGGPRSILRWAGKDATEEYEPIHPAGTIEKHLPIECHLGLVNPSTVSAPAQNTSASSTQDPAKPPPLSLCLNLHDIEHAASKTVSKRAWAYFHSAADSLASERTNAADWAKISFRPRILRNVARVSTRRRILGQAASLPVMIAPAALARLAHPDGELCLARGAARYNVPYCASAYSSVAHGELAACVAADGQGRGGKLFFQMYVPRARDEAAAMIAGARDNGCAALVVTVDTPVVGRREEDERHSLEAELESGVYVPPAYAQRDMADAAPDPEGSEPRGPHSAALDWEELKWIRKQWGTQSGPLALKGIQTAEDAKLAMEAGVDAIYLSNHGGRQADHAPSAARTMLEIRKFCPEVLERMEVVLDGGVRRGADVLKAVALGASGVALGRPFMYALGAYGTEGVFRAIEILRDEIENQMRLIGVTSLDQLNLESINTTILEQELPRSLSAFPRVSSKL